jgi:hypothetical protein
MNYVIIENMKKALTSPQKHSASATPTLEGV